jgi:hypothetical protein
MECTIRILGETGRWQTLPFSKEKNIISFPSGKPKPSQLPNTRTIAKQWGMRQLEMANDARGGDYDGDNEGDKDEGDRDTVAEGRGWQRENECTLLLRQYIGATICRFCSYSLQSEIIPKVTRLSLTIQN